MNRNDTPGPVRRSSISRRMPAAQRHVEHRHRLVGDQQVGPEHHGAGDDQPLALTAGELVRVAAGDLRRRMQPGLLQRAVHQVAAAAALVAQAVDEQRLGHHVVGRQPGIQRLERVLEHDLDPAPELAQGRAADVRDVLAAEQHSARRTSSSRATAWTIEVLPQPDSPTRATISPRADREADPVHGADRPPVPRARRARYDTTSWSSSSSGPAASGPAAAGPCPPPVTSAVMTARRGVMAHAVTVGYAHGYCVLSVWSASSPDRARPAPGPSGGRRPRCPGRPGQAGSSVAQRSIATGHRSWNRQPGGGVARSGG